MENIDFLKFRAYEIIRIEGLTNMCDVNTVAYLSNGILSVDDVTTIIFNYEKLKNKYKDELKTNHVFNAFLRSLKQK